MIDGGLFTRDFLIEGITATPQWTALDPQAVDRIRSDAVSLFSNLTAIKNPTEAVTEKDLIYPLLAAIGWGDRVFVQPNASVKGRADVPDALLFADEAAHDKARKEKSDWKRFQHGLCVVEAKRWNRVLDREETGKTPDVGVPSTQMLRYLRRVDDVTKGGLRWGILTNGRVWRLYWQGALSVAEDFLEIDLGKALNLPNCGLDILDKRPGRFADDAQWRAHTFKLFAALFGREAFLPFEGGQTFHDFARAKGKFWEARVAKNLSDTVFDEVFPALSDALTKADPTRKGELSSAYLEEVRHGALILLYRLLFVLYAEDRNLLPDETGPYADYCLTKMRFEIADCNTAGRDAPTSFVTYWPKLTSIFRAIANGDDALGIPPYNGGLFEPAAAPILERTQLPDAVIAKAIFGLSHEPDDGAGRGPKYINYRDLSVQQLGSVYERILEFGLRANDGGGVEIDADDEARHKSGSYYTPEELVTLIISRAVGPLIEERVATFKAKATALASDRHPIADRLKVLTAHDPAIAILSLKICDPAMGSGHFLVSLVDWLADEVLDAMAEAAALVSWGAYTSPLAERIDAVRTKILSEAKAHRWPIVESQLDDRHVVRRMVLKRVVHGVDKNPMAVELAKVSLWLHSFTVGAPLSFLDHHLRCGDSVIGAFVRPTVDALQARGALFNLGQITRVEQVAGLMSEIEETTDNDIAEVASSKAKFGAVEDVIEPIEALFSLLTAERLMGVFDAAPKKAPDMRKLAGKSEKQLAKARADAKSFERAAALQLVLEGTFGDPIRLAAGAERVAPPELVKQLALLPEAPPDQQSLFPAISVDDQRRVIADALVEEARALAELHHFFHWEIGFPNIWSNLASAEPIGGFDAVIGNPPYVRQELLGDEVKRALKRSYAAFDGMADLYVYFYEQGLRLLRPGGRMGYVVTNKWLKAGYAENLRDLFAARGWLEFVADFGHAKHFFPDADVFPSVLVMRKPDRTVPVPADAAICVIPREAVPRKGLAGAVAEATFTLPRAMFTKESWVLEPRPVMDLLDKIRRNGVPLTEYTGVKPLYGIKTGLNEAFLIDTPTRERLVRDDPACAEIIKPYLRGQDIERWHSPDSGLFMIVLKSSGNFEWPWANAADEMQAEAIFAQTYPALHRHMKVFEEWLDAKTNKKAGLRHREDRGRFWWELRACDYYAAFEKPKVLYVDITWSASFSLDRSGRFTNNTGYFIPSGDPWIVSVLNAPIGWHYSWRRAQHGKDEALRYFTSFVEGYPIPPMPANAKFSTHVERIGTERSEVAHGVRAILDWLRHEFGLDKPGTTLTQPHLLDADGFVAALRKV
ncbi:Eco57I restriction-modification methylase domain-containing protein [Methylocystis hirsuta]|uniref:site-specific DNA-methyltransferase (adenine-specific) n=1 Tax=Methylocystis hirsuta TaxID=369798 RepID=A0A3M9XIL0_9HYPH|nr:Eco57I restriction-modification methylase domain-containing protein [Methylocystis hirsuta]RNJ47897.1 hypothetical protein D1O30_20775 [Methylocystis hirsuta]